MRGYSEGTQQCARTVMFVRFEPTTLTWPVPPEIPTSPPKPLDCMPHRHPDTVTVQRTAAGCVHRMPPKHKRNHRVAARSSATQS